MKVPSFARIIGILASLLFVASCGSSSSNSSPGSVVTPVPVESDGSGSGGDDDDDTGDTPTGETVSVATVIPDALSSTITDSGTTTSAAFGSRPIYTIDVSQLDNGEFDPTGFVMGNDFAFTISGGALRVTSPSGASSSNSRASENPDSDCVLQMSPGTILAGDSPSDFLIISQSCAIVADGSEIQPIVMTASAELEGSVESNDRGLWGGLVINGRAPINDCPEGTQGGTAACTAEGEANSGTYGGARPTDDSGLLRYVSVRYAGSAVDSENELNGIAFQGVGSGTTVEFIQVHNNLDDGVEFFGGTVDAKYVVLTGNADDSLDWTDGWTGRIQYLYIEQASDAGDNGIEADSNGDNESATPRSNPHIANMTIVGNEAERAIRLRVGTGLTLQNSVILDSDRCLTVEDSSRDILGASSDPTITIEGTSFGCATMHDGDDDGAVDAYLASATGVSISGDPVTPVSISDTFFTNEAFLGAFGADDWATAWTVSGSVSQAEQVDFGCPAGTTDSGDTIDDVTVCEIEGTITEDVLLTANNYYQLVGRVLVGNDNADSATLTLQAGTAVFGDDQESFLVVSRGSQIVARGTMSAPVVFTSEADLLGDTTEAGQWGGLVINGNAPINDCPEGEAGGTEGCTAEGEANSGTYGGADAEDNSGVLSYVVVKYAGSAVDSENELNGIAFQGVGSATQVDHIQVHQNLDDGVEFFGGTVDATYVVLTDNQDDSLDWTDGWQGRIQYLIINQAEDAGDNGIEADSNGGDEDATPRSLPVIANMTILGNPDERAIRLRVGSGLELYNSIVQGSANCLAINGDSSLAQLGTGIQFGGVSFGCPTVIEGDDVDAIQAEFDASENVSTTAQAVAAVAIPDESGDAAFFDQTEFTGALLDLDNDWTMGWTVGNPSEQPLFDCPDGTSEVDEIAGRTTCELSGVISSDLTLPRGNYYLLDGKVSVGNDNADSAVLTIESGTTIIGDNPDDFLVVSRGSQIQVNGTASAPVIMTAVDDVEGTIENPETEVGLWGGLVINGNAPINDCPEGETGGTAGCTKEGEANSGTFGGADSADSSGVLNYLVVKYAGSAVDSENELNGIAFQGVGSGTEVDFIQVFNNFDDGVEFFGGTVNVSHVVLVGNGDDSMDWTDGWTGAAQWVHILQVEGVGGSGGDNGIEADNLEEDVDREPRSAPRIANMSIIGASTENAIRLRLGTGVTILNSEVSGSATCLRVGSDSIPLLGDEIELAAISFDCDTVVTDDSEGGDVQNYIDSVNSITTDGSAPTPSGLPSAFDQSGNTIIGSDVENWGGDWTVGLGL